MGLNTPDRDVARRAAVIETIIPRPPADVAPMRAAFSRMVSKQWRAYVPDVLLQCGHGLSDAKFAKGRFIGEMYARACYSMLLVSANGPASLRVPVRATALVPRSRVLTIRLGSALLVGLDRLLPRAVHRQLMLTSALMGMLDVVLDEAAAVGEAEAVRIATLIGRPAPASLRPDHQFIATLANRARRGETKWQTEYWESVLQPSVRDYCRAEVLAVKQLPDDTGMGHRWAGIDAAIKGMWYVAGPHMGLGGEPIAFEQNRWNREQHWMADTSLLMQMIDDWVDQDEDRGARLTPVATGDWTPSSVSELYEKTVRDLTDLLHESGIRNSVLKAVLADLYRDYLHTAIDAMRMGVAA